MAEDDDPFLHSVVGKLTVVQRERRGKRWAYSCRCECGAITLPRRAAYIRRRGPLAACKNCSAGDPRAGAVKRPEPPLPEKERYLPAGHPIWRSRAQRLAAAIIRPMPLSAVLVLAKGRFWWPYDLTREVLAAASGVELVKNHGLWSRAATPSRKFG